MIFETFHVTRLCICGCLAVVLGTIAWHYAAGGNQELLHSRISGSIHTDPIVRCRHGAIAGRVSEGECSRKMKKATQATVDPSGSECVQCCFLVEE